MEHTFTITVKSDRTHDELLSSLRFWMEEITKGYCGDPTNEELYGAEATVDG